MAISAADGSASPYPILTYVGTMRCMDDIENHDTNDRLPKIASENAAMRRLADLITSALAQAEVLNCENASGYLADAREIAERLAGFRPLSDKAN